MKGQFVFQLCLVVLGCFGHNNADDVKDKVNAYIDEFIAKATNETGAFIDPLDLEEIGQSFEREIGFVKVKGEAKLYDGKIEGLSSLKRKGDAVVIDLDDVLIVSCKLAFEKITAFYRGALLLNDIGPKITLNAKVGYSEVFMFLTLPAEGGAASLISFNINKLSNIRVSVWGLGAMGWAASLMSSLALNALEKPVAKAASVKVFEVFSKEIERIPYSG